MGSEASFEAYDGVELTLERGVPIRGRALLLSDAVRMHKLWDLARQANPDGDLATSAIIAGAVERILAEFPALAGLDPEIRITAIELFREVLPAFLFLGGTSTLFESPMPASPPAAPSPTLGSTT